MERHRTNEALLRQVVATKTHITLAEIQAKLVGRNEGRLPDDDLVDAAQARVVTEENNVRAAEQDQTDIAGQRRIWCVLQRFMDPDHFVLIDEIGVATNMVRHYS